MAMNLLETMKWGQTDEKTWECKAAIIRAVLICLGWSDEMFTQERNSKKEKSI